MIADRVKKWQRVAVLFIILYTVIGFMLGQANSDQTECGLDIFGNIDCEEVTDSSAVWGWTIGGFLAGVLVAIPAWIAVDVLRGQDEVMYELRASGEAVKAIASSGGPEPAPAAVPPPRAPAPPDAAASAPTSDSPPVEPRPPQEGDRLCKNGHPNNADAVLCSVCGALVTG